MKKFLPLILAFAFMAMGCTQLEDDRVHGIVRIDLTLQANWAIYGVNGLGTYRYFIKDKRQPSNFPYKATSMTGIGGVLLIDAGIGATNPTAYEMACPVERKKSVVVQMDDKLDAVCPSCGSRYNVLAGYGQAVDGPAHSKKYALHRYRVVQNQNGGYMISN